MPKVQGQFSSIVTIDPTPPTGVKAARAIQRCSVPQVPPRLDDAVDLAMRYGKDIIDGKVQATEL
jgi:hypothetical protein